MFPSHFLPKCKLDSLIGRALESLNELGTSETNTVYRIQYLSPANSWQSIIHASCHDPDRCHNKRTQVCNRTVYDQWLMYKMMLTQFTHHLTKVRRSINTVCWQPLSTNTVFCCSRSRVTFRFYICIHSRRLSRGIGIRKRILAFW
jgi:hypothetical protein